MWIIARCNNSGTGIYWMTGQRVVSKTEWTSRLPARAKKGLKCSERDID